ncbi:MAG TPA: tetratricopeptide repeat protein [Gemmatimonadaceae bacterium]|jgi:tetratricopeptide (TPR) repeat protein|nr:tetratricopeptide repeat protein [Gemmatimonadaceae bacterium]
MSNIAKLKKKAAEFEQKKQYEKALELYQQVLDFSRTSEEDRDVPLYNRVGDLHYRLGNSEEAISYYEKAVDLYAEGGFFNNAIALCNKILRYSPNRSSAYYKLGLISAKKGFNSDAKQNFLEYADRMQKVGKLDEAFRALKEFADLCPGQDDVRLMLAEQLARADRKPEALEQLQLLYDTLDSEGRSTEAAATVERMKAIDPGFTPKKTATPRQRKKEGLVFLDLGYDDEMPDKTPAAPRAADEPSPSTPQPLAGLELTSLADEQPAPAAPEPIAEPPSIELVQPIVDQAEFDNLATTVPESFEKMVKMTPEAPMAAVDIAPLVDEPPASSESTNEPEPQPEEPIMPLLHEASLHDPLAGLDVISAPDETTSPSELTEPWPSPEADDDFVDLAEWLERTRTPQSTRMVAHDTVPENNEQKDFAEMLDKFKAGVARSLDDTDFDSHYDLGIAFREMGLIDEAISAFQKATRGQSHRIRASEALGECFLEKGEPGVATTVLERVTADEKLDDDQLIGVLYFLGRAAEELDNPEKAASYYQRVVAVNMNFRDAARRLSSLAKAPK